MSRRPTKAELEFYLKHPHMFFFVFGAIAIFCGFYMQYLMSDYGVAWISIGVIFILIGIIILVIRKAIQEGEHDNYTTTEDKQNHERKQSDPTPTAKPYVPVPPPSPSPVKRFSKNDVVEYQVGYTYNSVRGYSPEEHRYWNGAIHYIARFASEHDYASVWEFVINIWNDKDHIQYAYDLYTIIDLAIDYMYPMREKPNCTDMILELGYMGLSILDEYKKIAGEHCVWRFPTQIAILLEKSGRIDEAIELCDFLDSRGVRDRGYDEFKYRKERLIKKRDRQR